MLIGLQFMLIGLQGIHADDFELSARSFDQAVDQSSARSCLL